MAGTEDKTSRYAAQPQITVSTVDGSDRVMSAPRISQEPPSIGQHQVRAGDRLDLLGLAALGDTTQWWRLADANPWGEATRLEEPGTVIELPGG